MKNAQDDEIEALSIMVRVMNSGDDKRRERMMQYLHARFFPHLELRSRDLKEFERKHNEPS